MQLVISVFAFIFGSIIGSFLNVVILRHNTGLREKRSFCYSCGHRLTPRELVPIFSYLFQGGKCLNCKSKISSQYFWVEFTMAVLSLLLMSFTKNTNLYFWFLNYVLLIILFSFLLCTFVYDLKHKIMPDRWTLGAFIISIVFVILNGTNWVDVLIGAIAIPAPLLLINIVSRGRAMGFGDVKFAVVMGVLLGVSGGFAAMIISFWLGGLVGVYLLIKYPKKVNRKSEIPFAPFLILGTVFAFLFNIQIGTILVWFSKILG